MKKHETYESVPGILRPFKSYLENKKLPAGAQIVYYGVPGTCTPFIELLGFAIRSLPIEQVFVPLMEESKARKIYLESDVGMQVSKETVKVNPSIVVLMGGLSMPNSGISAARAHQVAGRHPVPCIGVCFMKMFQKTGWLDVFSFELLIDANIAPVDVWIETG
jgi:Uncharacterized protein conserved in archaea